MNGQAQSLAEALRDIHSPPPPEWWPPAPGWWLLAALVLVALYFVAIRAVKAWQHARKIRRIRNEFESIVAQYRATTDGRALLSQTSALMKRVALSRYPRRDVASLSGQQWLEFLLDQPGGAALRPIANELKHAPYQSAPQLGADRLISAVRAWLRSVLQ